MVARPSPVEALTVAQNDVPLGTVITDAITTRMLRLELRRLLLGLFAQVITVILLLSSAIVFIVVGIIRLGDALGRACGQWFGDVLMGDIVAGLAFLGLPLVGLLLLRLHARR
jgi:hypothetical protein